MDENNNQNVGGAEQQNAGNTNQQNTTGTNQQSAGNGANQHLNEAYNKVADAAKDGGKSFFANILNFDVMISAKLIKLLYFIMLVVVIIGGIAGLFTRNPFTGSSNFVGGLLMLILGPIAVRVWAELMVVVFNINDNIAKIKDYFYNQK
jgi:hypothetical protein